MSSLIDDQAASACGMAVFPLLADPAHYRACETDLLLDHDARKHWIEVYTDHTEVQLKAARSIGISPDAVDNARSHWLAELEQIRVQPERFAPLDILRLDERRSATLGRYGIRDEFRLLKQRENEAALSVLQHRLAELEAIHDDGERLAELFRGILAGNLFDMGVAATATRYTDGTPPFQESLNTVPARPWHIDDVARAESQLRSGSIRKAVMFVDNAGADVVLGAMPMVRELLRRGIEVIVTANAGPAHNDITHAELLEMLPSMAAVDAAFASSRLQLVCSGNHAPLIDLSHVSDELAAAAGDVDLVILIGMGRAIESNFSARFSCASWKVAMLKDPQVAASVGGALFDAVVKVQEPGAG